jgi:alpha,alpha-trehalase
MKPYYKQLFELFERAHLERINKDGKAITDARPNKDCTTIQELYEQEKNSSGFDVKFFFTDHFTFPQPKTSGYSTNIDEGIVAHIRKLWTVLSRNADTSEESSSLIALPHPYIVPGGRFAEVYYWDTYFTMLGMVRHGLLVEVEHLIDNFSYLIQTIGYIPNGNRDYYIGRSQPPFFCLMVELLAEYKGDAIYKKYIVSIETEYQFFCREERNHQVGNHTATTYYDENTTPRMEMYGDDVKLASQVINKPLFFKNVRAACESGWDFSSRWLDDPHDLKMIDTLSIIPVDLNCLILKMESLLALHGDNKEYYQDRSELRKKMINDLLWDKETGCYKDYNIKTGQCTKVISAAALFPLFFNIASDDQAKSVVEVAKEKLIHAGGIACTDIITKHQWDAPNGWAPLQWISYVGLKNYDFNEEAKSLATRWMALNERVFNSTGKLMEKYNVVDMTLEAGGGEYDVQDGFGWSNGVYIAMLEDLKRS